MSTQLALAYEPAPLPVRRIDATPEAIRDAQKPATVAVLLRLMRGPATTSDIMGISYEHEGRTIHGCGRFSARLLELRRVGWTIEGKPIGARAWRYELRG